MRKFEDLVHDRCPGAFIARTQFGASVLDGHGGKTIVVAGPRATDVALWRNALRVLQDGPMYCFDCIGGRPRVIFNEISQMWAIRCEDCEKHSVIASSKKLAVDRWNEHQGKARDTNYKVRGEQ